MYYNVKKTILAEHYSFIIGGFRSNQLIAFQKLRYGWYYKFVNSIRQENKLWSAWINQRNKHKRNTIV